MRDLTSINWSRIIRLFKMDLRKMLRGKAFYVMLGIAVIIPVMMLTQMHVDNSAVLLGGASEGEAEAFGGGMMGLSILGALTGILLCIYIGRDYSTGFIKNIVTVHANKLDYIISKELTAVVCSAAIYAGYILSIGIAGVIVGSPLKIPDEGGFILYFAEHLISSAAMSALVISINMIFRRLYGWSICFTFYIASGIIIMAVQNALRSNGLDIIAKVLDFTIAGSASLAKLDPNPIMLPIILGVSAVWVFVYSMIANKLMNSRDIL